MADQATKTDTENKNMSPAKRSQILVIGVGGAGSNVLDRISLDEGLNNADLLTMNTDVRALNTAVTTQRIQLGSNITHGLGTGGDPDVGRATAIEAEEEIRQVVSGREMVFICCGLGGGTGSGAAPILAQLAREEGAFVCVFANMPFDFEGRRRVQQAEQAMDLLRHHANALIAFENDRIGELILNKQGIQEAFVAADQTISHSIVAIINLVRQPGLIRIGMDDVLTALRNTDSRCLFGLGTAKGDNRAQEALKRAFNCPLLDRGKMLENASNLIVHITGGESLTLHEVENLMRELIKNVHPDAHILFGASVDNDMGEQMSVTIISSLSKQDLVDLDDDSDNNEGSRKTLSSAGSLDIKKKTAVEIKGTSSTSPPNFANSNEKKKQFNTATVVSEEDVKDDDDESSYDNDDDDSASEKKTEDINGKDSDYENEEDSELDEENNTPVKKEPSSAAARIGHTVMPSKSRSLNKEKIGSFFKKKPTQKNSETTDSGQEQELFELEDEDLDVPAFLRENKDNK